MTLLGDGRPFLRATCETSTPSRRRIFENELAHRIVTYHAAERDTTAESGERHQGGRYRTSARFEESLGAVFLIGSRKRVEQHGDVSYRDTESENVEIRHLWVFLPQR